MPWLLWQNWREIGLRRPVEARPTRKKWKFKNETFFFEICAFSFSQTLMFFFWMELKLFSSFSHAHCCTLLGYFFFRGDWDCVSSPLGHFLFLGGTLTSSLLLLLLTTFWARSILNSKLLEGLPPPYFPCNSREKGQIDLDFSFRKVAILVERTIHSGLKNWKMSHFSNDIKWNFSGSF